MAYAQAEGRRRSGLARLIAAASPRSCHRALHSAVRAALLALVLGPWPVRAETAPTIVSPPHAPQGTSGEPLNSSLSPECRVPGSKLYTLAKLGAVKDALTEKRVVRVLSVGSSSAGLGAASTYPTRLENALKRSLPNVDIEVESRGLPGEIASGAAERLRGMLAEIEPDLVVWQVGTNDALARVELEAFGDALDDTIRYVKLHDIDIVLIDPLFIPSMADDEYYNDLVGKVQAVAQRERVPLVRRYEAMRFLSKVGTVNTEEHMLGQHFRLNDLGLRCMAEHAALAISLSLLQSNPSTAGDTTTSQPGPSATPAK